MNYDIDRILTSGGASKALEGVDNINLMQKIANEHHKIILAGSGLTPNNTNEFLKLCKVKEIHMGSGVKYQQSNFKEIDIDIIKKLKQE